MHKQNGSQIVKFLLFLNHIIWLRCNQTSKKDKQSVYTTFLNVITYISDISKAVSAK